MKNYLLITISILFYSCGNGQTKVAFDNQDFVKGGITVRQSQLIYEKAKVFPENTQLSIAFIKNGIAEFYGVKRTNDSIKYIDNSQKFFEIGSITKVFSSTLLADFVLAKKIGLDDDINDYLKFQLKDNQKITFKELANHTSGLPRLPSNLNLMLVNKDNPYKKYKEPQLKEYLTQKLDISKKNRNKYEYSNLGAGLLGYTLCQIANTSYEELLKTRIFSKYQMNNTTTNRNQIEQILIKGQNPDGKIISNWDLGILSGAGAILSTSEDLSKFAIAQLESKNKDLELTRTKTFKLNENMDIGLGWHIIKNKSNQRWVWHNGGTGGYTSSMAIDTEKRNGIIILSNVSAFSPKMGNIDQLCFELMEALERK